MSHVPAPANTRQYREENGVIYCDRWRCPGSTGLKCYRTGVPICQQCATLTPVGYLSKDAARAQQNLYFNATLLDYALAAGAAFVLNLVGGFFIGNLGIFIAILASFFVGGIVGEAVFRVLRKRRGRYMREVVSGAMIVSAFLLLPFVSIFTLLVYSVIAIGAALGRIQVGLRM
jgi:hypothetical protein